MRRDDERCRCSIVLEHRPQSLYTVTNMGAVFKVLGDVISGSSVPSRTQTSSLHVFLTPLSLLLESKRECTAMVPLHRTGWTHMDINPGCMYYIGGRGWLGELDCDTSCRGITRLWIFEEDKWVDGDEKTRLPENWRPGKKKANAEGEGEKAEGGNA